MSYIIGYFLLYPYLVVNKYQTGNGMYKCIKIYEH